ncbi:hypothetical protein GOBAR_DD27054 [Gossypium barbadense]|nr:hypothetical protein GOBAR_DD27054 [Gossypium barbadense]
MRMLAKSATLRWTTSVLRFRIRFNTSVMNIPSCSHMVKTTFIHSIITVIFVKMEEIQAIAHKDCAIDAYSYMKLGKTYTAKDHPHPLTFTRKIYDYPLECHICEEHCEDLFAECLENGCNYIVHWKCIDPYREDILQWWRWQSRAED